MSTYRGKCLSLFGAGSIQSVVFGTNRLRENCGASELVRLANAHWNGFRADGAETLFCGGGNAAVIFPNEGLAHAHTFHWSDRYLRRIPGLRVVAAHVPIEQTLQMAYQDAVRKLKILEDRPQFGADAGAFPGIRQCLSTGLAAHHRRNADGAFASTEAVTKSQYGRQHGVFWRHVHREFQAGLGTQEFAAELDKMTGSESGHIAICCADGYRIGKQFELLADADNNPLADGEFRERIAALSRNLTRISRNALNRIIGDLAAIVPKDAPLPFRPIIYAGDDVVFVCRGNLGIALAVQYLRYWREESQQTSTACAGVLIMPQKFPFSRGHALAKQLLANAKRAKREKDLDEPGEGWVDFQVILEGSTSSLSQLRDLYPKGLLTRPYCTGSQAEEHSFERFSQTLNHFRGDSARSRAKGMLEALARGGAEAHHAVLAMQAAGTTNDPPYPERYWWDAMEMMDFYQPIREATHA